MPSAKQLVNRMQIAGGLNQFNPAHLIGQDQWVDSVQMRHRQGRVSQFAALRSYLTIPQARDAAGTLIADALNDPVIGVVSIPSRLNRATLLFFTDRAAFQLTNTNTLAQLYRTPVTPAFVHGAYVVFNRDTLFRRWAFKVQNGFLFFTNLNNPLQFTNGASISSYAKTCPAGKYLEIFYDHLIIGHPLWGGVEYPARVMWSDVFQFDTFTSANFNEADFYDTDEDNSVDSPFNGITGIKKIQTKLNIGCYIYKPQCILEMQYTDIQHGTFKTEPIVDDIGNFYQWSLISYNTHHAFIGENDFYSFNGLKIDPIGSMVRDFFFADLSTDLDLAQKTYGFVDRDTDEAWWVYCSRASSGSFDSAVIFNFQDNKWYRQKDNNILEFHRPQQTYRSVGSYLGSTIASLTGQTILNLGNMSTVKTPKLFCGTARVIYREQVTGETQNEAGMTLPVLESGDFAYGDLETFKEIDTIVIHATYTKATGINVYYSARNYFDETINWVLAGVWTSTLPEGRLSFPRVSGRVFRFKFVATGSTGVENFKFTAWGENVLGIKEYEHPEK